MNIQIIEKWVEFEQLSAQWNELLEQSDADSVFLTWSWIEAWRRTTRGRVAPFIVSVRTDDGQLVGLLPLWSSRMTLLGIFSVRALRFLGDSCNALEYPDCVVHPEFEAQVMPEIAATILSYEKRWDIIWLPNCTDAASTRSRLSRLQTEGVALRTRPAQFARLPLVNSWESYEASIASTQRQKNRRLIRRFRDLGGEFEVCDSVEKANEFLKALYELHGQRWREAGETGSFFSRPSVTEFYQELAPLIFKDNQLFMTGYRLNGELKAVQFGFQYRGTYSQVQEGFDPELPAGIGNALRYFSLQRCIENGLTVYDFLGGHTEHKRRWGGILHTGFDLMLISSRSRLLGFLLARVWPTGRWIRDHSRKLLDDAAS
ncbi:MAG: CelD/BcsL family acetyltransferase involved in cellulose biosynthesis [Candidatus Azotimanducaceae bacterium]|jgi:CelD/BcsL family acetyltransferase involved in cellulose biosynthesis